ncbi:MAG TPA: DUF2098 domain-containing protein [Methanomicrobia archaeon]|nr:DUF2098 domain-containing protein [Methanomicrobia archaeon]
MMNQIDVGSYARYVNTGTIGKVVDMREEDGMTFAKLDATELYYDITYLEAAEKPTDDAKRTGHDLAFEQKTHDELKDSLASGDMSENVGGG